jgi:hypothetical protein
MGAAELAASALAAGDTAPAELATHALAALGPNMSDSEAGAGVGVEEMVVDASTVQACTQSEDGAVDDQRDMQDIAAAAEIAAWTAARQE